jgi:hypothetical protein
VSPSSQRSSISGMGSFKNFFQRSSTYPSQSIEKSSPSSLDEAAAGGTKSESDKSSTPSSSSSSNDEEEDGAAWASRKSHLAPLPPRRPTFEMHRQSLEREINAQGLVAEEESKKETAPMLDPVKVTPMSLASCSYALLAPAVCMAMFVFLVMFLLVLIVDSSDADAAVVEDGTNSSDGNFMGG